MTAIAALPELTDYMASCACRRFVWGKWDCCLLVADIVLFQTGFDPAARWRGTYSTEEEAVRLVESLGGMCSMMIEHAHLRRAVPPYRNGDIGIARAMRGAHAEVLVVLWQGRFLACAPEVGLCPVSARHVTEVFRV